MTIIIRLHTQCTPPNIFVENILPLRLFYEMETSVSLNLVHFEIGHNIYSVSDNYMHTWVEPLPGD